MKVDDLTTKQRAAALALVEEEVQHRAGPAKVNARRALEEAAERHGWTAGVDTDGDPFIEDGVSEIYVCGGFVRTVNGPVDTPAELMTLLLAAADPSTVKAPMRSSGA